MAEQDAARSEELRMNEQATTARDVIRAAVDEWLPEILHPFGPLLFTPEDRHLNELAERIEQALFGDGTHEQSVAHWRANAAEEKRKKQHVSDLLTDAHRELEALHRRLSDVQGGMIDDLHVLGEVLGHDRVAQARTPRSVFLERTEEVRRIIAELRRLLVVRDADPAWGHSAPFLAAREPMVEQRAADYPALAAILRKEADHV